MSQSVRDSLADAETLRRNVPEFTPGRIFSNLYYALSHGLKAMTEVPYAIKLDGRWSWEYHEGCAVDAATRAARAAFRACPGLRG